MSAADDFAAVLAEAATLSREAQATAMAGANTYAAQDVIRRLAGKTLEFRQDWPEWGRTIWDVRPIGEVVRVTSLDRADGASALWVL